MSAPNGPLVELREIQANVLRAFRNADAPPLAEYVFVQLGGQAESRAFLGALHPEITSCADWDAGDRVVVNVGLTYAGLQLLTGRAPQQPPPPPQPPCALATFDAFKEGSEARSQRTPALGDTGASHPNHWESHYTNPALHAVISLSADTERGLATARRIAAKALKKLTLPAGVIGREVGARLDDGPRHGIEHFGFVDGIGQPDIADSGLSSEPGGGTPQPGGTWKQIPLGEFVLGYPNARKIVQSKALLKNGSFVVFRKLRQDVPRFREFLKALAARTQQSAELLAARFVGRWRSGAPLILAPTQDDPPLGADPMLNNNFRYVADPHGIGCPIGAHIRRANPRDEQTGPTIEETETRRMIRRGIPYGRLLPASAPPDNRERGLLFVAVVADIEQQFEFVQASWINSTLSSSLLTLDADKDPIIGANDETGKFAMPGLPEPTFAWKLPRFVSVKGSAYFFWPSLGAIKQLSDGTVADADWPFDD